MSANIDKFKNEKWMQKSTLRFRGSALPHATPVTPVIGTPTPANCYWGWSFLAGAGGATIQVYDGKTAAGVLMDTIIIAANAVSTQMYPTPICPASGFVFYTVTAGSATGSVRIS